MQAGWMALLRGRSAAFISFRIKLPNLVRDAGSDLSQVLLWDYSSETRPSALIHINSLSSLQLRSVAILRLT